MVPKVTFIVPCYNLSHLLAECVNSILSQTYENFEVLVMDDCSPDQTHLVAQSFCDTRVKHIRNETNLGHLRNYNKGIGLARGEYLWLMSADDCLRRPYVLEQYVQVMDEHPNVGFVFCPAMGLQEGRDTEVVEWSFHGTQDTIFKGHDFLDKLLEFNCIASPTGMVRKQCYEKGVFPLDLPHSGDWYLWCLFALYGDVAYFGEPMVSYRFHESNMTNVFLQESLDTITDNDIKVLWRLKENAAASGFSSIAGKCVESIYTYCVNQILRRDSEDGYAAGLSSQQFERSLVEISRNRREGKELCERVYESLGNHYYWRRSFLKALQYYGVAARHNPLKLRIVTKYILLKLGSPGIVLRERLSFLKRLH